MRLPVSWTPWNARYLLLVVPGILCFVHLQEIASRSPTIDFYQFWLGAAVTGSAQAGRLYIPDAQKQIGLEFLESSKRQSPQAHRAAVINRKLYASGIEPTATPLFYVVFRLFESGSFDLDVSRFQTLSNLLFIAAVLAACALERFGLIASCLLVAFFSTLYDPIRADVMASNVTRLQLFLVVAYAAVHRASARRWSALLAGAILAFLVLFKPNLAFVPILLVTRWVVDRQWWKLGFQAIGFAAAALALIGLSGVYFEGLGCWRDWFVFISEIFSEPYPIEHGNVSVSRVLLWRFGLDLSLWLALALWGLAAAVLAWTRSPSGRAVAADERDRDLDLLLVWLGAMILVIAGNIGWYQYYVLLIPLGSHLIRASCFEGCGRWYPPIAWRVLVASAFAVVVLVGRAAASDGMFRPDVAMFLVLSNSVLVACAYGAMFIARAGLFDPVAVASGGASESVTG